MAVNDSTLHADIRSRVAALGFEPLENDEAEHERSYFVLDRRPAESSPRQTAALSTGSASAALPANLRYPALGRRPKRRRQRRASTTRTKRTITCLCTTPEMAAASTTWCSASARSRTHRTTSRLSPAPRAP